MLVGYYSYVHSLLFCINSMTEDGIYFICKHSVLEGYYHRHMLANLWIIGINLFFDDIMASMRELIVCVCWKM